MSWRYDDEGAKWASALYARATLADEDILEKSEKIARGLAYMIFFL